MNKAENSKNIGQFNCQRIGKSVVFNVDGFSVEGIRVYVIASSDFRVLKGTAIYLCDSLSRLSDSLKYRPSSTLLIVSLCSRRKRKVKDGEFFIRDRDFIILSEVTGAVNKRTRFRNKTSDELSRDAEKFIRLKNKILDL